MTHLSYAPHHHHPYEYPTSYPPPRDYAPHPYMVTPPPHYVPPPYNPTRRSRYDNPYLDGIRPQRLVISQVTHSG